MTNEMVMQNSSERINKLEVSINERVNELEVAIDDMLVSSYAVTGESEFDADNLINFAEYVKRTCESLKK